MRRLVPYALVCVLIPCCLFAQTLTPPKPELAPVPPTPPPTPIPLPPPPVVTAPPGDFDPLGWISLQVTLGQQLGVRGQVSITHREGWNFVGEGFYGLLLTKFGGGEAFGAGGRAIHCRCSRDGTNTLLLGPGVNLFYQTRDDGLVILAPSLDIAWLHGFGSGGGWEIGLNVGLGVSLTEDQAGNTKAGQVTPIISVYTGFRF